MNIKFWWPLSFLCAVMLACILIFPSDLRLADLLGKAGKYDEAVAAYRDVLERYPHRHDVRVRLGRLYLQQGETDLALREFERAGEAVERDPQLLLTLADLYAGLGRKPETVAVWEKLVAYAPDSLRYRRKLAEAYEWNEQTEAAIAAYDSLLAATPDDPRFLHKLVSLNVRLKRFEQAVAYLDRLVVLEPDDLEARVLLGNLYLELGRKAEAAREFEHVLRNAPDNAPLRQRLAELYVWMGEPERAVVHYEYLVLHHVLNDAYFERAVELTRDYDPERTRRYFQLRLRYLPEDDELRQHFAEFCVYIGDIEHAAEQLRWLAKTHPEQLTYLKQLGWLYQEAQELDAAATVFQQVVDRGEYDPKVVAELLQYYRWEKRFDELLALYAGLVQNGLADPQLRAEYAQTLLATGRLRDALQQYRELVANAPREPAARVRLAELYLSTGDEEAALDVVQKGLEAGIEEERFLVYAGDLLAKHGRTDAGLRCYEKLVQQQPERRDYVRRLAELYVQVGQTEKAAELYGRLLQAAPTELGLRLELADLYWRGAAFERMRAVLRDLPTELTDRPHVQRELGRFYFERAFYNEAVEHLTRELRSAPEDSAALRMLGLAYAWSDQPQRAREVLRRYHDRYPNDYYTHYQLGEILRSTGRKVEAEREFRLAWTLLQQRSPTRETRLVEAKLLAHLEGLPEARTAFDALLADYPNDLELRLDYAETLLQGRDYPAAEAELSYVLQRQPDHYRAWRLKSRWYFEQGKYREAAVTLAHLAERYPDDVGLKLALADAEQASGDWYRSKQHLKQILARTPRYTPAETRLRLLQREVHEGVASEYRVEEQSESFLRRSLRLILAKATSSLLHVTAFFTADRYSAESLGLPERRYETVGADVTSRFSRSLQTSFGSTLQRSEGRWYLTGRGAFRWYLSGGNSAALVGALNQVWNDPLSAALVRGRRNLLRADFNFAVQNRWSLWHRLDYEWHKVGGQTFGQGLRAYLQVGYRWWANPTVMPYYLLYLVQYRYAESADRTLVSVPEGESNHYLGLLVQQQLAHRLYYQVGGSVGYTPVREGLLYYGVLDLEYALHRRWRLRAHLSYGRQTQLGGSGNNKALSLDLYYFY